MLRGVILSGGGAGGGGRVTVGVVFINSLLSSSTVFSDWSDISQGGSEKNFHSLLLIMNLINILCKTLKFGIN